MRRTTFMIAPLALLAWAFTLGPFSSVALYIALCLAVPVIGLWIVHAHVVHLEARDELQREVSDTYGVHPSDEDARAVALTEYFPLHDRSK